MKLIIDIPEIDYECAKTRWMVGTDPHMMDYYISKGIPLDSVKAEIEQTAKDYDKFDDYRRVRGLWIALDILDNIGKAESEDK